MRKIMSIMLCFITLITCMQMTAHAAEVNVGDEFYFGTYEQDAMTGNGPEWIRWIVLDVNAQNRTALVMSVYGLDTMSYHKTKKSVKWKDCDARNWLNEYFYYAAFSPAERAEIRSVNNGGSMDKVYLLDQKQFEKYVNRIMGTPCMLATDYAKTRGAYINENGESPYWIRKNDASAWGAFVGSHGGFFNKKNNPVTSSDNVLRPIMTLSFDGVLGYYDLNSANPGIPALTKEKTVCLLTGPANEYGIFKYCFDKIGQMVWVVSRATDRNGMWWLELAIEMDGKWYHGYTGAWRIDIDVGRVPDGPGVIGHGTLNSSCTAHSGPGEQYFVLVQNAKAGMSGSIVDAENGWICLEYTDQKEKDPRRFWVPLECVDATFYN